MLALAGDNCMLKDRKNTRRKKLIGTSKMLAQAGNSQVKIISVMLMLMLILLFFISCSSVKGDIKFEQNLIKEAVEDFINEYQIIYGNKPLEAITIYVGKTGLKSSILISDSPKESLNSVDKASPKLIGKYKNVPLQIYGIENFNSEKLLNSSEFNFRILTNTEIEEIILEYDPNLLIQYNFNEKLAKINLANGEYRSKKW